MHVEPSAWQVHKEVYSRMAGQPRADGRLVCVCFSCSNKFQLFMGHAEARLAMQRLGLLLAAVASLSGAAACQTFAGQCVGMISGGEGGQHHVSLLWRGEVAGTCRL